MNIRCPQCQAVFRVDPEKVPALGVKARCARCSAVFALNRNGIVPQARAESVPAAAPAPAPAPTAAATAQPASPAVAEAPPAPRPIPPMPMPGRPYSPPTPPATAAASSSPARPRPSFGKQDPQTRANRIARALVSDIVAYHRERRDQTLAAGTLKFEFREEIRKSWEEYVEQVGLDLARSTPYFRDALNAILADGKAVF